MTDYILFALVFPVVWPFIAKRIWKDEYTKEEMFINIGSVSILVIVVLLIGGISNKTDLEVWNGQVLSKERKHDTYEDPYDCFCTYDSNGYRYCMTCYETRYTVTWKANTSVGGIRFKHLDRSNKRVYNEPDPDAYVRCQPGQPVAMERTFTNHILGSPESLFSDEGLEFKQFEGKIPPYPRTYDWYRINRVVQIDSDVPQETVDDLNKSLNMKLRKLGSWKQVNINVIFTALPPEYRFAVEAAWLGGKKNDVTIFIGTDDNKTISWADVMTFAKNKGNEFLQVELRDELLKTEIDSVKLSNVITKKIETKFDRIQMSEFEYIENNLPEPLLWSVAFISIFGPIGLSFFLSRNHIRN